MWPNLGDKQIACPCDNGEQSQEFCCSDNVEHFFFVVSLRLHLPKSVNIKIQTGVALTHSSALTLLPCILYIVKSCTRLLKIFLFFLQVQCVKRKKCVRIVTYIFRRGGLTGEKSLPDPDVTAAVRSFLLSNAANSNTLGHCHRVGV